MATGLAAVSCAVACRSDARSFRLGTTYTVAQSGALAVLESLWTGPGITVVVAPSGQILRTAANGDFDVVITHAPALEDRWLVAPNRAELRCPFVASRFAVVGPAADPAHVATATSAVEAFRRIAGSSGPFVSRADSSGTHVKELALWKAAGIVPAAPWRIETGADQATTLHLADERSAYALADLPTLATLTGLGLHVLFTRDTALLNPYTLYVVRQAVQVPAAEAFARWAVGAGRAAVVARRLPNGTPAFVGRTGGCAARPDASATPSPSSP